MKHRLAIWLVPLLVVAIGYSAALRVGLLSDDYEMLQSALHAPDAWSAFTLRGAWDRTWWRPWAIWSFYLEVHALGRAAWTFHAFSLVAHLASAILLGRLVARLTRDERAALVASALFAAMPVQAEAVTWISGRFDVLATLGTLLALVAWLRYAELGRKRDLALLLGAVVFALGSKETSALAPILLAGVTLVARIRPSRRLWIAWSVVIGLTIGWFLMRERALHSAELGFASGEREPGPDFSLDGIPRFVAQAMLACFVPSTGRSRPELLGLAPLLFVLATAVAFGVAVRSRTPATPARMWRRTTGFLGLFLLCVLPYAAWQGHLYPDLQSSRYLYLASAFACAALAPSFGAALANSSRSGIALRSEPAAGIHSRLVACAAIASFVLTACQDSSRVPLSSSQAAPILLYAGTGTSGNDVAALEAILSRCQLAYSTADSAQLNDMSAARLVEYRLLIIPGGNFMTIGKNLGPRTAARLHDAVQAGSSYLGICAGGYLAGNLAEGGLDLASGVQFKCYSAEQRGISKAVLPITGVGTPTLEQYWELGPEFSGFGAVVGRYPDGTPAIVEGNSGKGWVILSGVHPEAPASWRRGMSFSTPASADLDYAVTLIRAALERTWLPHE